MKRIVGVPADVRFWFKVDKTAGPEACWVWLGPRRRGPGALPYGLFMMKQDDGRHQNSLAHRFSWKLANGPIPDRMCVLHRCDNASCVNPAHLFLGTQADNIRDKCAKGRQATGDRVASRKYPERMPRGVRHHNAKLDDEKVRAIRAARRRGDTYVEIGAAFGISWGTAYSIIKGRTWRHVE